MKIIVEGKESELELPREKVLLKEVIEEVEAFLLSVGKVPNQLSINGEALTQAQLEASESSELKGDETLEFGVVSIFAFFLDNIQGAQMANESLLKSLKEFSRQIHGSGATEETEGANLLVELNGFFDFWIQLNQLLGEQLKAIQFSEGGLKDQLEKIRSLLEEVVAGMEASDFVLAADLIEYEVQPLVESIDEKIPEIQKRIEELAEREEQLKV